jgi:hypothetical protein
LVTFIIRRKRPGASFTGDLGVLVHLLVVAREHEVVIAAGRSQLTSQHVGADKRESSPKAAQGGDVQDDRADAGVGGGQRRQLPLPAGGGEHDVAGLGEVGGGGPADFAPSRR